MKLYIHVGCYQLEQRGRVSKETMDASGASVRDVTR